MNLRSPLAWLALASAGLLLLSSCTRRQLAPGLVAGGGALLATSGGIYRATLDTDEPFGETPGQVAGTTVLLFGGLGLLLTGVIWSVTSSHCDDNGDCWTGDVCELRSHACIDGDAARRLRSAGATAGARTSDASAADASDADASDAGTSPAEAEEPGEQTPDASR